MVKVVDYKVAATTPVRSPYMWWRILSFMKVGKFLDTAPLNSVVSELLNIKYSLFKWNKENKR